MNAGSDRTGAGPQGVPSEEELRAAYEAELARITATDMIAQAAVSLLNIGARKLGPPPASEQPGAEQPQPGAERDLEQVRDSIDAAMALLAILERRVPADQVRPLRDALSSLQMAYASEVGAPGETSEGSAPGQGGVAESGPGEGGPGEGGPGDDGPGDGGPDGGAEGPGGPGGRGGPGGSGDGPPPAPGAGENDGGSQQRRPGPAESSGRLWVPGT